MKGFFEKIKEWWSSHYRFIVDFTEYIVRSDYEKTKVSAALGYLFFFIPLVMHGEAQYARFHCNQAFINTLLSTIGAVLLSFIPYAGPFLMILQEIFCVIWAIRGFILALKGKARGIPLIGWITLIAYRLPGQD